MSRTRGQRGTRPGSPTPLQWHGLAAWEPQGETYSPRPRPCRAPVGYPALGATQTATRCGACVRKCPRGTSPTVGTHLSTQPDEVLAFSARPPAPQPIDVPLDDVQLRRSRARAPRGTAGRASRTVDEVDLPIEPGGHLQAQAHFLAQGHHEGDPSGALYTHQEYYNHTKLVQLTVNLTVSASQLQEQGGQHEP